MHIEKSEESISVYKKHKNEWSDVLRPAKWYYYICKFKEIEMKTSKKTWQIIKSAVCGPQDGKSCVEKINFW